MHVYYMSHCNLLPSRGVFSYFLCKSSLPSWLGPAMPYLWSTHNLLGHLLEFGTCIESQQCAMPIQAIGASAQLRVQLFCCGKLAEMVFQLLKGYVAWPIGAVL